MGTPVVWRRHLQILDGAPTVRLVVFDPHVRELHRVAVERQLVRPRPLGNLVGRPIRPAIAVATAAIRRLEKALILALELFFQHDPPEARAARHEPLGGFRIRAVEMRVVRQLARFGDAGVKRLRDLAIGSATRILEHGAAHRGQRHERRACLADDMSHGLDQIEITQVPKIARPHLLRVAQVRLGHDAKGADCRQCPDLGATQFVRPRLERDALPLGPARQVQIARKHVARIAALAVGRVAFEPRASTGVRPLDLRITRVVVDVAPHRPPSD